MGQGSSLGIGHNFELPFPDAAPVSSPIKRTQDKMSPRVNEYPVKRTYSGTYNNVWNEFTYFKILLSSTHGDLRSLSSVIDYTAGSSRK